MVVIEEPTEIDMEVNYSNVSCFGLVDGTIVVNASAGAIITINGADYVPNNLYGPGIYNVNAILPDGNNIGVCSDEMEIIISQPNEISLAVTNTDVSCFGEADGTIFASANENAINVNYFVLRIPCAFGYMNNTYFG